MRTATLFPLMMDVEERNGIYRTEGEITELLVPIHSSLTPEPAFLNNLISPLVIRLHGTSQCPLSHRTLIKVQQRSGPMTKFATISITRIISSEYR